MTNFALQTPIFFVNGEKMTKDKEHTIQRDVRDCRDKEVTLIMVGKALEALVLCIFLYEKYL